MTDWDDHWRDRSEYDERVTDPERPPYSPAVCHALWSDRPRPLTAAAIHILDGIGSDILPRQAVTMDGVDWDPILETSPHMSSGEKAMIDVAYHVATRGVVDVDALRAVRRTVDESGNRHVREALDLAGVLLPVKDPTP